MVSPRQRRLAGDFDELQRRFHGQAAIRIEPVGAAPPDRYRITFAVPALRLDAQNNPVIVHHTTVDVVLPIGYPREKPFAVALDPVFHPNFAPDHICLADFWSPAQPLADVVVQLADMLQWRRYNVHSPLNAVAADWAVRHKAELPIGNVSVVAPVAAAVPLSPIVIEGV